LYSQYIEERIAEGRNDQFHKGGIDSRLLGEERFVEEAMNKAQIRLDIKPTVSEIVETVKMISNIDDETLCSRQRGRSVKLTFLPHLIDLPTKLAGLPDATAVMAVFVQSGLFH